MLIINSKLNNSDNKIIRQYNYGDIQLKHLKKFKLNFEIKILILSRLKMKI
jgi:hypothetical protein